MDDRIIALCARGEPCAPCGHLEDLHGLEVPPALIGRVPDTVRRKVKEWRARALDAVEPGVIFDAPHVKVRDKDSRIVRNRAVYLALGITGDGQREVPRLSTAGTEGAKLRLSVRNEVRNRGVQDMPAAVVDGPKGFPEAINPAFPEPTVQTCVRQCLSDHWHSIGLLPPEQAAGKLIRLAISGDEKTAQTADSGQPVRPHDQAPLHPDAEPRADRRQRGRQADPQTA